MHFAIRFALKIREAEFCVAMLNDPPILGLPDKRAPSANVYYEYGLAVAHGKEVIPVIRNGAILPFDIQHIDAVIYENNDDLKNKLRKSIVAVIRRNNSKERIQKNAANSKVTEKVYGPLYGELKTIIDSLGKKMLLPITLLSWTQSED